MSDTKEKILFTALRLFAQDGYEAVSVSAIAGELGMTKGALYKHYKNKRDIFDSIFESVCLGDVELAKKYGVPEEEFADNPLAFKNTSMENLKKFIEATFRVWIENEFVRNFRKMLTLEQYRNAEMAELYRKCILTGSYIEDLFREMIGRGVLKKSDPKLLALEFMAPYHFLISTALVDESFDIEKAANLLTAHIERFMETNQNLVVTNMDYVIRAIKESEYPLLDDFIYEAIFIPDGVEAPEKSIINNPDLQVYVAGFGTQKDDCCVVAEVDNKVVGAAWVRIMNDYGHIDDETPSLAISIYKQYRGVGIGTALMKKLLISLKEKGYNRTSLAVQKTNYAVKMYQKLGYEIIDENEQEYIMANNLY